MNKKQKEIALDEMAAILDAIGYKKGLTEAEQKTIQEFANIWYAIKRQVVPSSEAAELRGISRASVSDLIKRGRLHVIEFGGKKFVTKKELQEFKPAKTGPVPKEESDVPVVRFADARFEGLRDWLTIN